MTNYMQLIADPGNAIIADDAAFDVSGDVEWRFDLAIDWSTAYAGEADIANRYVTTGNDRQWRIALHNSSMDIRMTLGAGDGTFRGNFDWSEFSALSFADGQRVQLRIRLDADNGSTETEIEWSYRTGGDIAALDNNDNWTVSATDMIAGVQSWKATAQPMNLGNAQGNNAIASGNYYRFMMWADIAQSSLIVDVDFTDEANIDAGATDDDTWNDGASANDWVMNGTHETAWDYIRIAAGGGQNPAFITAVRRNDEQLIVNPTPKDFNSRLMRSNLFPRGATKSQRIAQRNRILGRKR